MNLNVLLFAEARQSVGSASIIVGLPPGSTVVQLRQELSRRYPRLRPLLDRSAMAVNQRFADDATQLNESDEIAWIPPVSGG
jgi:molybdopterin converting factor subunit 1